MKNITIVGGGNQAHALIGVLSGKDYSVSMLTRKAPEITKTMHRHNGINIYHADKNVTQHAKPINVASNASELIPNSDIIIITNPANDRARVLKEIAPYISKTKTVLVGAIPGWGGFHWLAENKLNHAKGAIIWALKDTPVMASHLEPGKKVTQLGKKEILYYAVNKPDEEKKKLVRSELENIFEEKSIYCDDFIEFSLCAGNPIEHLPIIYGKIGPYSQWDGKPFKTQPFFYENISELEAYFVKKADEEQQSLVNKIREEHGITLSHAIPLKDDIIKLYGDQIENTSTLYQTIRTNAAYKSIKIPMKATDGGYQFDLNHRIFSEDIPYGLDIFIEIGKRLGLETPFLIELRTWLSSIGASYTESAVDYIPKDAFI
ncbi:NAD/NADP octopine/nopaline dehydrogenase family protein [Marinobacter sp. NFXS9]|uniref:NAD/NADP octopine/nopaline dehydrogenase family protein n=1 Tax=Marinobacter sp. NFXS9 TaxID=2818433 RepID=UPI0032DE459D